MRPLALLPLAACVLLLTGCGGGGTLGAVAVPSEADSSPAAVPPATVLRHSAAKADRYRSVQLLMSDAKPDGTVTGTTGVLGWEPDVLDASFSDARTGEVRYVDGVEYLDQGDQALAGLGAKGRKALAGRTWLKVDQNSAEAGKLTASFAGIRPSGLISLLAASPLVVEVGPESVNGALATHYTGTIHVAHAAKSATGAVAAYLNEQMAEGDYFLKLDVWIGSNGLPLLVRDREKDSTQDVVQGELSVSYSQYGKTAAAVTAPPADQVYTAEDLDRAKRLDG